MRLRISVIAFGTTGPCPESGACRGPNPRGRAGGWKPCCIRSGWKALHLEPSQNADCLSGRSADGGKSEPVAVIDHSAAVQRVQNMFAAWQSVPTASLSFTNAGALLPAGSYKTGDLTTAQQYNDVLGACRAGAQNPVILDADGTLMAQLGLPTGVIGFNSACAVDSTNGYITASAHSPVRSGPMTRRCMGIRSRLP